LNDQGPLRSPGERRAFTRIFSSAAGAGVIAQLARKKQTEKECSLHKTVQDQNLD
jgi:hypothetical protein